MSDSSQGRSRSGPLPMPELDGMTVMQLRSLGKASHRLICAYDSGRADPTNNARLTNFERRVAELRVALYGGAS